MLLGDMTWPDFQRRAHDGYAIVPVGAVEPHGPHLPLASDTMISDYFAGRLASAIDNLSFLCEAARALAETVPDARVMIVSWWEVVGEQFRDDLASETGVARRDDHHAAMVESSLVMHIAPGSVQPGQLAATTSTGREPRRMRYHVYPLPPDATTDSGIVYTADKASAGLGERVADQVARNLAAAVRLEFDDPRGQ